MDNIDVNFHQPAGAPLHNRYQVLQKYVTSMRHLRHLAEQNFQVRSFYFDNFLHFNYFQNVTMASSNVATAEESVDQAQSLSPGVAAAGGAAAAVVGGGQEINSPLLAHFKLELLQHILDRRRQILCWLFYILLVALCVLAYRRHETWVHAPLDVASQEQRPQLINPGMRLWRQMTLPLIQRFPRLTELYDESCLMENPFFQIDLNCDPCAGVQAVQDLSLNEAELQTATSGFNTNANAQSSDKAQPEFVPFIFKINQSQIQLDDFYNIYLSNSEIFQRDAYRVQSTHRDVTNLEELFAHFNQTPNAQTEAHSMWRCNRMVPARLLRQLFSRPSRLSNTGIALERFIAFDTAQAPAYTLPQTECANVYIQMAAGGSRFVILRPTSECRHRCRTLSVRLPESFVLVYNWWYWKPVSAPDPLANKLSISLIGSHC